MSKKTGSKTYFLKNLPKVISKTKSGLIRYKNGTVILTRITDVIAKQLDSGEAELVEGYDYDETGVEPKRRRGRPPKPKQTRITSFGRESPKIRITQLEKKLKILEKKQKEEVKN